MANCIACKNGWNSFGTYESFCSEVCEENYKDKLLSLLTPLLGNAESGTILQLWNLVLDDITFTECFEELVEKEIDDRELR